MRTILLFLLSLLIVTTGVQAGGPGQVLTKDKVETALRRYILQKSPWQPEQIEVNVKPFTSPSLAPGHVVLRILKPSRGVTPGLHSYLLAVEQEGNEQARIWVRSELRVFGKVVVASRPLARYQVVTPGDIRLERRDLGALYIQPYTTVGEAVGKQASRAIEVNEIFNSSMVKLPKVVFRGRAVSLIYETSKVKVRTLGQAMEDGRVGDIIRVKNPSSGQLVQGLILDARNVRVNW